MCSRLAPPLSQAEEIYLQSLSDVAGSLLGTDAGAPAASAWAQLASLPQLLINPTAQARITAERWHLTEQKERDATLWNKEPCS